MVFQRRGGHLGRLLRLEQEQLEHGVRRAWTGNITLGPKAGRAGARTDEIELILQANLSPHSA